MAKTTIKVRVKAWKFFNAECKVAGLRRDDILNRNLPGELAMLAKISACDDVGERWLKRNWVDHLNPGDIDLQIVPFQFSDEVVERLNAVCAQKRVPRDAFFNCALDYITKRIYDAVVVLKELRTNKDIASKIIYQEIDNLSREELSAENAKSFMLETVEEALQGRDLDYFAPDYYAKCLSFDVAKVEQLQVEREIWASEPAKLN